MSENKNVIIFQDESGKKSNKWSVVKMGRAIKHFKWWIIGATVLGGAGGMLGIELILNKQTQRYTARYVSNLATELDEETGTERFIDGTIFNYASIISRENMEEVKKSNDKFAKINVEKLVKDNAVSVAKEIIYVLDENDKPIKESKSIEYTITASAKYFPNSDAGKDFLEAVIASGRSESTRAINNYSMVSYLDDSFMDSSLIQQSYVLGKQYKAIEDSYSSLVKKFGPFASGNESGASLENILVSFKNKNSLGTSSMADAIAGSLYANCYVDYEAGHEAELIQEIEQQSLTYEQIYYSKNADLVSLKNSLEVLTQTSLIQTENEDSKYIDLIIELNEKIIKLQEEVDDVVRILNYGGYYLKDGKFVFDDTDTRNAIYHLNHVTPEWVAGCEVLVNQINECYTVLKDEIGTATHVYRYSYTNYQNSVSILDTGHVVMKGGLNMFIGLVAGLVLGFVVSTLVCTSIETFKKEEEETK